MRCSGLLRCLGAVALALALSACAASPDPGPPEELAEPFGETRVTLEGDGDHVELDAYVADTDALRRRGLMGWESLPDDTGMLFAYDRDATGGFWMRDTLIPLSIAFADADGRIHTVRDMEPCRANPCPSYKADEPYRYALEVEQGLFEDLGVEPGWRLVVDDEPHQSGWSH